MYASFLAVMFGLLMICCACVSMLGTLILLTNAIFVFTIPVTLVVFALVIVLTQE